MLFACAEVVVPAADLPHQEQGLNDISDGTEENTVFAKRKKASKAHKGSKKLKLSKIGKKNDLPPQPQEFNEIPGRVERGISMCKKASKVQMGSEKLKLRKNKKEQ